MIKITFDTNCIINLLDSSSKTATSFDELSEIMRYALEGSVNIAVTTRVEYDLSKDKNAKRKEKLLKQIVMFPTMGSVARFGVTRLGAGDFFYGKEYSRLEKELVEIVFPSLDKNDKRYGNKLTDIDHIASHIVSKRDIFITDDLQILRKAVALKEKLGLVVETPKQCLERIISRDSPLPLVTFFREKWEDYSKFLCRIIENNKKPDNQSGMPYQEFRDWFIKKFPKIKDTLANCRLRMRGQNIGGQVLFSSLDVHNLQRDINPFDRYYECSQLEDTLGNLYGLYQQSSSYNISFKDWLANQMGEKRDLLVELEGYLD